MPDDDVIKDELEEDALDVLDPDEDELEEEEAGLDLVDDEVL